MPALDLTEEFALLRRSYPKTAGKVQDTNAARRLDEAEVARLLAACSDGTWRGSRDQLAIRIGLLGLRVSEVCDLTWGALSADGTIRWTGKGRRPRVVRPGATLLDLLPKWKRHCERQMGHPITSADRILCGLLSGGSYRRNPRPLAYGQRLSRPAYARLLLERASTDLGHLSPHDLRRTTAARLRKAGFDLYDIQQVLGHAQASTTVVYLDASDTTAIDRAATILD